MPTRKKAAAANARGEVTIVLEGQEYHLRPSYEAIVAIEEMTGKTTFELANAARNQALTLAECGIVTARMMQAFGESHPGDPLISTYKNSKPENLARLIMVEGVMKVQPRLAVLLIAAVTGGVDASGEWKPAKGSPPPSAG